MTIAHLRTAVQAASLVGVAAIVVAGCGAVHAGALPAKSAGGLASASSAGAARQAVAAAGRLATRCPSLAASAQAAVPTPTPVPLRTPPLRRPASGVQATSGTPIVVRGSVAAQPIATVYFRDLSVPCGVPVTCPPGSGLVTPNPGPTQFPRLMPDRATCVPKAAKTPLPAQRR